MRRGVTARNQAMTRMPEITTPAAIPILIASDTSAMFIVVFLCSIDGNTKSPANYSPGFDLGLSPQPVTVLREG